MFRFLIYSFKQLLMLLSILSYNIIVIIYIIQYCSKRCPLAAMLMLYRTVTTLIADIVLINIIFGALQSLIWSFSYVSELIRIKYTY